ncbi:hypothetical protein BDY17DRAFT_325489 [Neohortaea acidophila]|uniref:Letm1 RBD domain-containing protein n=1 Tax=Neohortaea acidophila TaxID=245834 RepID=A0A6A6PPI1_9PEZI|nr:uncharacterized protein BDY17DRAFT_325489 [Neohortaea acidophila]KAF2481989.1 hypothetical protein BDY17DRAFT_325489 [Neohortaea acidophila]
MTIQRPVVGLYAIASRQYTPRLVCSQRVPLLRHYAQQSTQPDGTPSTAAAIVKSALTVIESRANADPVNAPRSTLPPPLNLPTRGDEAAPIYYFRLGRAYGTFYKDGIKAVWFNFKASRLLQERIKSERNAKDVTDAVEKKAITRAEFQLLARNSHDIGKLPIFSLMVLVFGEWLVLIVPFVPSRVPGTCRIPKQTHGMTLKAEERRRVSFRHGIPAPSKEQMAKEDVDAEKGGEKTLWPMAFNPDYARRIVGKLRDDQLHHLSCNLGLHNSLWDRVQLAPPAFLLRRSISNRLQYLTQDDFLLLEHGGVARLTPDELRFACEQRGLDTLGQEDKALQRKLEWWLNRQREDDGKGRAMLTMLFRRPNAWNGKGKR